MHVRASEALLGRACVWHQPAALGPHSPPQRPHLFFPSLFPLPNFQWPVLPPPLMLCWHAGMPAHGSHQPRCTPPIFHASPPCVFACSRVAQAPGFSPCPMAALYYLPTLPDLMPAPLWLPGAPPLLALSCPLGCLGLPFCRNLSSSCDACHQHVCLHGEGLFTCGRRGIACSQCAAFLHAHRQWIRCLARACPRAAWCSVGMHIL